MKRQFKMRTTKFSTHLTLKTKNIEKPRKSTNYECLELHKNTNFELYYAKHFLTYFEEIYVTLYAYHLVY